MKKKWYLLIFILIFFLSYKYLIIGLKNFDSKELIHIFSNPLFNTNIAIISYLKLPRLIIAIIGGFALGISGFVMQSALKNYLVSPQIIGTNSGASLAVIVSIMFFPKLSTEYLVISALIGATFGALLIYFIGIHKQKSLINLVIAGITGNLFLKALTQAFILLDKKERSDIVFWLSGSLSHVNWDNLKIIILPLIIAVVFVFFFGKKLEILDFDDSLVISLGENIMILRIISIFLCIIITASIVSICGPIGFVGLIIPNIVRKVSIKNIYEKLLLTGLLGALLLLASELLAKNISFPFEIPVGIVTSLIGAPYFIFLALKEESI